MAVVSANRRVVGGNVCKLLTHLPSICAGSNGGRNGHLKVSHGMISGAYRGVKRCPVALQRGQAGPGPAAGAGLVFNAAW